MNFQKRSNALIRLGEVLDTIAGDVQHGRTDRGYQNAMHIDFTRAISMAPQKNPWFTMENILYAMDANARMLSPEKVHSWTAYYDADKITREHMRNVGVISAGNIPFVGLHDVLCTLMSGHRLILRPSGNDAGLHQAILDLLVRIEPDLKSRIEIHESRLTGFDAVIATGSNNTLRYFDHYFRDYPHVFRKNRSGAAILKGDETDDDLKDLADDVFRYYGLGCRNVSFLLLPGGFDTDRLFGNFLGWSRVQENHKYVNNYQYYRTLYLLNREKFLDNGFVMLKEDEHVHSPLSVLHYGYYQDIPSVQAFLGNNAWEIQCVVSHMDGIPERVPFGRSQYPELWDYADGIDTMDFLLNL